MRMPFSREEFVGVFALYNESVWPLQWLLIALAVIVIMLAVYAMLSRNHSQRLATPPRF